MGSVLAVLAAVTGALLMSWSVLLYQGEERSISDALASWWIRIDDVATSATSRNKFLIRDVAFALVRWLDNVFGERLVSLRALGVSICLSFSSATAFVGIVALIDPTPDPRNPKIVLVCLPLSYFLFSAAVAKRSRYLLAITSSMIACVVILTSIVAWLLNPIPVKALSLPAGILLGVGCDFLVVVLARRLVMAAAQSATVSNASAVAVGSALLGTAMLCTPVLIFYHHDEAMDVWQLIGLLAGLTNLYAGVVALAFVAVNVMFLLQRMLWSAIARPLYAIERFGLFQRRRTLFYCGAMLMALGFPKIANVLLKTLNWF